MDDAKPRLLGSWFLIYGACVTATFRPFRSRHREYSLRMVWGRRRREEEARARNEKRAREQKAQEQAQEQARQRRVAQEARAAKLREEAAERASAREARLQELPAPERARAEALRSVFLEKISGVDSIPIPDRPAGGPLLYQPRSGEWRIHVSTGSLSFPDRCRADEIRFHPNDMPPGDRPLTLDDLIAAGYRNWHVFHAGYEPSGSDRTYTGEFSAGEVLAEAIDRMNRWV